MICIGIDPGKKGAMAIIKGDLVEIVNREDGYVESLVSMVSLPLYFNSKIVCCLEHVSAMPGNGAVSMFNFGAEFGYIKGLLEALEIPYELVRPQKWKKEFSITADKNTSIEVAKRLFPAAELKRTDRCKKDDDNRAEALLMAEYARRNFSAHETEIPAPATDDAGQLK